MFRKRMFVVLALLVFGIAALRCAAVPLSISRSSPPIGHMAQASGAVRPDSVRGFDVSPAAGLGMLDQHAEVMFDN